MVEERERLRFVIQQWNNNRLDLFEISDPDENLEFHGVMRFYFQDAGQKVATKCIRVHSTATVRDVIETLIEKFRPDMRMLSIPEYALYETHENGDERRLLDDEKPLLVQLNWNKDDREGRFLLRRMDQMQIAMLTSLTPTPQPVKEGNFIRRLSRREKKELKKQEKLRKASEANDPDSSVAEKLYTELPETSFTRSISNPEAVMRKRRAQKLEKKLQQFRSKDGGPDTGGTLKIYGESLCQDVPYKTLLLSISDTAAIVVKDMLDKYGLIRDDPANYCLVQTVISTENGGVNGIPTPCKEYILDDDECPLAILMNHPSSRGSIMFHVRRRPADYGPRKRKKKPVKGPATQTDHRQREPHFLPDRLPFLVELGPDGAELGGTGRRHQLTSSVIEVGTDHTTHTGGQSLQLFGPAIQPRHCVIAHTDGIVTITPCSRDAETHVNGQRVYETTILQHGCHVRFGRIHNFRFIDASQDDRLRHSFSSQQFLENRSNYEHYPVVAHDPILPAVLEFREDTEEAFLHAITTDVDPNIFHFKLAPTYTLYMAARFRASTHYRSDLSPTDRAERLTIMLTKVAVILQNVIQTHHNNTTSLAFWMANASEFLHFLKQDRHICGYSVDAQDILADAVQVAFKCLVDCMKAELSTALPVFLEDKDDSGEEEGYASQALTVLKNTMALLRKCRVNAALTIQLFSKLFHFINMWLFNCIVTSDHNDSLCTRLWGERIKDRLARIELWAEKQGIEMAAECHLSRLSQAAILLTAPKSSPDDIASIANCFKLNSLQLRALLENYEPEAGEEPISKELIDNVVAVAETTADSLAREDGREVRLEEDDDLQLPFLLPEDGYSCDVVRNVPSGLAEFLAPLQQAGFCRMTPQPSSSGNWTIYMHDSPQDYSRFGGHNQDQLGIYIKSVVPGGAADQDGRLQAGDQLLSVDGKSLIGISQEKAAEYMVDTGPMVTLEVARQGALYHGLATILSQPSPQVNRGACYQQSDMTPYGEKYQQNKCYLTNCQEGYQTLPNRMILSVPLVILPSSKSTPNLLVSPPDCIHDEQADNSQKKHTPCIEFKPLPPSLIVEECSPEEEIQHRKPEEMLSNPALPKYTYIPDEANDTASPSWVSNQKKLNHGAGCALLFRRGSGPCFSIEKSKDDGINNTKQWQSMGDVSLKGFSSLSLSNTTLESADFFSEKVFDKWSSNIPYHPLLPTQLSLGNLRTSSQQSWKSSVPLLSKSDSSLLAHSPPTHPTTPIPYNSSGSIGPTMGRHPNELRDIPAQSKVPMSEVSPHHFHPQMAAHQQYLPHHIFGPHQQQMHPQPRIQASKSVPTLNSEMGPTGKPVRQDPFSANYARNASSMSLSHPPQSYHRHPHHPLSSQQQPPFQHNHMQQHHIPTRSRSTQNLSEGGSALSTLGTKHPSNPSLTPHDEERHYQNVSFHQGTQDPRMSSMRGVRPAFGDLIPGKHNYTKEEFQKRDSEASEDIKWRERQNIPEEHFRMVPPSLSYKGLSGYPYQGPVDTLPYDSQLDLKYPPPTAPKPMRVPDKPLRQHEIEGPPRPPPPKDGYRDSPPPPPPPTSTHPLLNASPLKQAVNGPPSQFNKLPNPWDREEKEKMNHLLREAVRQRLEEQIALLESMGSTKTHQQEELLNALKLEQKFKRRAEEEARNSEDEEEDEEHEEKLKPDQHSSWTQQPPSRVMPCINGGCQADEERVRKVDEIRRKQQELEMAREAEERLLREAQRRQEEEARRSSFQQMASQRLDSLVGTGHSFSPNSSNNISRPSQELESPIPPERGSSFSVMQAGVSSTRNLKGSEVTPKRVQFSEAPATTMSSDMVTPDNRFEKTNNYWEDPNVFISEAENLLNTSPARGTGNTPGVIGAQEVYRDPRLRRLQEQKEKAAASRSPGPEKLTFREKMKMFAKETGEVETPKDKVKISRAQRDIEHGGIIQ